ELIDVKKTDGQANVIMGTAQGMSIQFSEEDVRSMGRTATGVRGIRMKETDEVVGMDIVQSDQDVLIVTTNGYGKKTHVAEYRSQTRGGRGIKTLNVTPKNGRV